MQLKKYSGSHEGVEIRDVSSGRFTKIGIAKRSQTSGYESGTIRTIINDHVDQIMTLVLGSGKK